MSWLFLLMIPPLVLAAYRALDGRGLPREAAAAVAVAIAAALTVVPAYALRTKPSHGEPADTPNAPIFAREGEFSELQVEFGDGWDAPEDAGGATVRRLRGRGQLVIGPLVSGRPAASLEFDAESSPPARLSVRLGNDALAEAELAERPTRVALAVPAGDGPAVLELDAGDAVVTVPLASVRATVATG